MQATRRGFLRGLGSVFAAIPAVKLLPLLPAAVPPLAEAAPPTAVTTMTTYVMGKDAVVSARIGEYADYINFSTLTLSGSVTPQVDHLSKEMGHRLGYTLSMMAPGPKPAFQFPNRKAAPTKVAVFS